MKPINSPSDHDVIDIKQTLKARQLLECFDLNLIRLNDTGLREDEEEVDTLEMLSGCLEEAIENGVDPVDLQQRANQLAQYALRQGYDQHAVENLLTMRPNPNGKRLQND